MSYWRFGNMKKTDFNELEYSFEDSNQDDDTASENQEYEDQEESAERIEKKPSSTIKKILIVIIGLIAVLLVFLLVINGINKSKEKKLNETVVEAETSDYLNEEAVNLVEETIPVDGEIVDLTGFVGDLEVEKNKKYKAKSIDFTRDMVNYEKRRAISDVGMEIYWLDVVYKEKNYQIQIPFYIYSDLDKKGITIVSMEILTLEDDSKLITYMEVISNFREIIGN